MDILHTETNRGKKSIIYDGHTYQQVNILKNGNISYRSTNKSCKATVSIDGNGRTIVKTSKEHNHTADDRKNEAKELRIRSRKQLGDISSRQSKIVRTDITRSQYIRCVAYKYSARTDL